MFTYKISLIGIILRIRYIHRLTKLVRKHYGGTYMQVFLDVRDWANLGDALYDDETTDSDRAWFGHFQSVLYEAHMAECNLAWWQQADNFIDDIPF